MFCEVPSPQLLPLELESDLTWVFLLCLWSKPRAMIDMCVLDSESGKKPFFSLRGSAEQGKQEITLNWSSLAQDAESLKQLLLLFGNKLENNDTSAVQILRQSPLFMELLSGAVLVTKDQVDAENISISPFDHSVQVAQVDALDTFVDTITGDGIVAFLSRWLHDVGKMSGSHFLSHQDLSNLNQLRTVLEQKYGRDGKHTHPNHSYVGVLIVQRLFHEIERNLTQEEKENQYFKKIFCSQDSIPLLLNIIFHHHHFIYNAQKDGDFEIWFENELKSQLYPTLFDTSANLLVRFFIVLVQLRYADITATQSHHKHWEGNKIWMLQMVELFRRRFVNGQEDVDLIDKLEALLSRLPDKLD